MEAEAACSLADVFTAFRQDVFDVLALVTGEARELLGIGGFLSVATLGLALPPPADADSRRRG